MRIIRQTGTLFLLVIFLFGITGVSVFHHTCSTSSEERIAFYAEIFKKAPGSCCGDEEMDKPVTSRHDHSLSFGETSCCKSTTSFLSLKITSERQYKLVLRDMSSVDFPVIVNLMSVIPDDPRPILPVFYQFHSPPIVGKELIHFLHQIKIPAHPDLA